MDDVGSAAECRHQAAISFHPACDFQIFDLHLRERNQTRPHRGTLIDLYASTRDVYNCFLRGRVPAQSDKASKQITKLNVNYSSGIRKFCQNVSETQL